MGKRRDLYFTHIAVSFHKTSLEETLGHAYNGIVEKEETEIIHIRYMVDTLPILEETLAPA
jgi:hypothetical protein